MNGAIYVPAIGEQFNSCWLRKLEYKGFDLKFFTKKSHFEYDYALQCGYYGINGACDTSNYRERVGFPKNKTLLTDSGGFQLATFKETGKPCNITPIESLRWQEENGDIMFNLDVPPTVGKMPTYEDFKIVLNQSVINFKIFEKERHNYNAKLYNVLHGDNVMLMEEWYNKVKEFNTFDGWAVGVNPASDPMIQAMGMMFLHSKGEFDKSTCYGTHLFGKSGKNIVPTMCYIANKFPKLKLTYDSSSYNIGSIYRTYYLPFDIGPSLSFGEKFKVENPNITELPCECPVCKSVSDINLLNSGEIYAGVLLSLHNLYQYVYYNNLLNKMVTSKDKFLSYLTEIGIKDRTMKSFEFIDFCLEKGFDLAVKKFENDLKPQTINTSKQVSIFNY